MLRREEVYKNSPYAELRASDSSARIRIYTYAYEFPNSNNGNDEDWHMNYILLSINGVSAEINEPIIEGHVLNRLLKEVERFRDSKVSEVDFSFIEPEFGFILYNNSKSVEKILVKGEMIDVKLNGSESHIHFKFKTDLNMIDIFIKGIKQILKEYPPR